ncbi:MAG TPA: hypothetical protein VJG67_02905 [Candidatus Paceibacterota bacterium]
MFNISSFLQKFSKDLNSTELNRKQIIDIIKKHTQIELSLVDIEIKDYIMETKSSPAVKNKIFMYKEKILEEINRSVSQKIVDIR